MRWKSSAEQRHDIVSHWWAILLEARVRFKVIARIVACISCLEQLRDIDFTLHSYMAVKDGGWNFTKKPTGTNGPCKQRPMKLIRLVSLVFVKVHMARDLAVLVMSSGESRTSQKPHDVTMQQIPWYLAWLRFLVAAVQYVINKWRKNFS